MRDAAILTAIESGAAKGLKHAPTWVIEYGIFGVFSPLKKEIIFKQEILHTDVCKCFVKNCII